MSLKCEVARIGSALIYRRHSKYHRITGPAVVWHNHELNWMQYGCLHRVDGPAIIFDNNNGSWYMYNRGNLVP